MRRLALWAALGAAAALPAPAYYHFVHYLGSGNAPEKFDLAALPSKTVWFFVSQQGPVSYSPNDTFGSVLSQVRQAALTWNGVATSDLRVGFGGPENSATLQNTPAGDVLFEDLPPGVYGYGGPSSNALPVTTASGSAFVPIARSAIHLNRNLTLQPGPSYRETFFLTVVHEMGHALGLQHTFTSATMSQATTRATTLSHPLDTDDIAGLSALYPNAAFAQTGSITGKITSGGRGAHLTSVVAIRAGAGAVSALSNPDGTYRIDGIPPGQYFVYAHALPPDADIRGPWNADGSAAGAPAVTEALFYPGTRDVQQATPVSVEAGKSSSGIDLSLAARASLPLYDAQVFGYFNNYTIVSQPAFVNMLGSAWTVTASGIGLGSGGQAPGLNVQVFGGSAFVRPAGVRPFAANGYTYVALDLGFNLGAATGPTHLVFSTPSFLHVLPAGVILTRSDPPTLSGLSANADGSISVAGTNWASDSQIYFDGLPAPIQSLDPKSGSAVVLAPPGASQQSSTVTVYNSDGQNSQQVQAASPVTYTYPAAGAPAILAISPSSLPAGAEAMLDINTVNMNLTDGLTTAGFGTSDISVRRLFVLSPGHARVDVSVRAGAQLSNPDVSVISGFQLATAPAAFQIQPAVPNLPAPVPVFENALPGLNGSYAGATVSLYGTNLAAAGPGGSALTPTVTVNGQAATILYSSATQINLQLPRTLAPGVAVMNLNNGVADTFPLAVQIDTQPAAIGSLQNGNGDYLDTSHPAHRGDLLIVGLNNFAPANATIAANRVQVSVGGLMHKAVQVTSPASGVWQVLFVLNADEPVGSAKDLIVYLDWRSSYPAQLTVVQ